MIDSNNNEKYFFEICKNQYNDLFYFELKDEDGNIYLESDLYKQKVHCQNVIISVKINCANIERFEILLNSDQKWKGYLRAGNGKIIAATTLFDTKEEAKKVIEDLKYLSLKAPVIDRSIVSKDIKKNKHNQRIITPPPAYLSEGLTKRAYFAGLAMHAIISNQGMLDKIGQQDIVKTSLKYADRLLDEISKTEKNMI